MSPPDEQRTLDNTGLAPSPRKAVESHVNTPLPPKGETRAELEIKNSGGGGKLKETIQEKAVRLMAECFSKDYFQNGMPPATITQGIQTLVRDYGDQIPSLGETWKDEWIKMKETELRTGEITRYPGKVIERVDSAMKLKRRIEKNKPQQIQYKEVPWYEPDYSKPKPDTDHQTRSA